jgi:hypothetical protein
MMEQSVSMGNMRGFVEIKRDATRRLMPLRATLKTTADVFILVTDRSAEDTSWEF